jgi:hypothetical protein
LSVRPADWRSATTQSSTAVVAICTGGGNVLSACHSSLGEALDSTPLARHERWPVNNAAANSRQSKSLTENCDPFIDEGSV